MDTDFIITFEDFGDGLSPLAHLDTKTFKGSKGQASEMKADVISNPGYLQAGPDLETLTNGDQNGAVNELIRFILDTPTASETTFGVGTSKLFKISPTSVLSDTTWPQGITDMTEGESIIRLKEDLLVFYNKATGGDIASMPLDTEVIDPDWGSTIDGGMALEKAPHPSAAKEDIVIFGNGRYLGVLVQGINMLDTQRLDFGNGATVADVVFNNGLWWIAVNYGEGRRSQIYLYDGSAMSNQLSDEVGLGSQEIGFLYVLNGIVYVAYRDLSAEGYTIGWITGRQLKPLRYFSGSLPCHRQKTLFKNTILFLSVGQVFSFGAPVEQLPIQISCLTDGGYPTVGGIAAPFGTPFVSSTDGQGGYRLAKFSGLLTSSYWKSVLVDVTKGRRLGKINTVIVDTKPLPANGEFELKVEGDQGSKSTSVFTISGEGKTRHTLRVINLSAVEDIRIVIDFKSTQNVSIRKITCLGGFVER